MKDAIATRLQLAHRSYTIEIVTTQRVGEGILVVFDAIPVDDEVTRTFRLSAQKRVAFFAPDLTCKWDMIAD